MLSVDEALERLLAGAVPVAETELVSSLDAVGRVLAEPQHSTMNVPSLDNSAMDGYAVRAADVKGVASSLKVAQRIFAGSVGQKLAAGTAARIFTGAPIPEGADAIVIQENTTAEGDAVIINTPPAPGDWIRRVGQDIREGSQILAAGIRLRPQDTGLAASVGIAAMTLRRRVKLGLFFTGDELAMPGEPLPPGRIYNSARFTLPGLARQLGCDVVDYGIVEDTLAATRAMLRRAAAECDIIVTCGGVSVGEADFVKPAVEAEGELLMWRIAMKPGRPLAFGRVRAGTRTASFIGLPGNPVSSFVTFVLFARPFILKTQGIAKVAPHAIGARADFDWLEPDPRREFLRVKWNQRGGLDLYRTQDSAVLTSTVWADGLADNPERKVIRSGDTVRFLSFANLFQ
ncbi:MAG: molybdopterin molybdenumtransferase MoeA [Betaproteobacteria bacterium RIFCSPLOWO2_02_FULL_62_17]|nr:MAG: molybdopterin molybdenumtransferase MoeA [Betaproteobacteria bacterium RIFCSPLOWO2_02_FULL_62_17]